MFSTQNPQKFLCAPLTASVTAHSFQGEFPMTENFAEALSKHKRSPKLHLMREKGRTPVNIKMPFVGTLHTRVDALADGLRPGSSSLEPERLALHELFSAYPNIEDLSVSVNRVRSGCVMGGPPPTTRLLPLTLSENETFPPIRRLSMSGYKFNGEESLWRDRFQWHKLRSLSTSAHESSGFLDIATGNIQRLTELIIANYAPDPPMKLDVFLSSFHTLESLTVTQTPPSLSALACHVKLKHLVLHQIEEPNEERSTLNATDITNLNQVCPNIRSLELDLNPNGTWVS